MYMCYLAQKIDACMIVLFEVGMIMFVEFIPIYFSISPTQTFLGLHRTLTVLPHDCWEDCITSQKNVFLGGLLFQHIDNYCYEKSKSHRTKVLLSKCMWNLTTYKLNS